MARIIPSLRRPGLPPALFVPALLAILALGGAFLPRFAAAAPEFRAPVAPPPPTNATVPPPVKAAPAAPDQAAEPTRPAESEAEPKSAPAGHEAKSLPLESAMPADPGKAPERIPFPADTADRPRPGVLKAVEWQAAPDGFEVLLRTTRTPVGLSYFVLPAPPRLVLDLDPGWHYKGPAVVEVRQGPLLRVRFGVFEGRRRVVLDLNTEKLAASLRQIPGGLAVTLTPQP